MIERVERRPIVVPCDRELVSAWDSVAASAAATWRHIDTLVCYLAACAVWGLVIFLALSHAGQ
ncbi:MAG TPA: hypothetical protein VKX16_01555 [Chloroflexota bacterium]|nr:hypothetical protein [Chloroflexota bacterium]